MDAAEVIDMLALVPHPEGGWYRETWRHPEAVAAPVDGRPARSHGTAIYYLLVADERSHWHRVDTPEIWHHYDGAPLELWTAVDESSHPELSIVGTDLLAGERPQVVVPAGHWQAACSRGDWTLTGCTLAPGFDFSGFELAPPAWAPGQG